MDQSAGPYTHEPSPEVQCNVIEVCKCFDSESSSEEVIIPKRKQKIFSAVSRTEQYLRERRIPELTRFILAKIIADMPKNPADYGMKLLDDCMIYRSGVGKAPVLFEDRHLEAIVKSFDPGNRGWMSASQVRKAFNTIGFSPPNDLQEKIPTDEVLNTLKTTQERELFTLLSAGMDIRDSESHNETI